MKLRNQSGERGRRGLRLLRVDALLLSGWREFGLPLTGMKRLMSRGVAMKTERVGYRCMLELIGRSISQTPETGSSDALFLVRGERNLIVWAAIRLLVLT